jgi:2,3-bisphosphoglycerate-dependent phosphoglycerate mutase
MSILILVRHGQSVYNLENRFTGTRYRSYPLGEEEVRRAGEKLKDYKFEIAYTSMLIRAQKLANHS